MPDICSPHYLKDIIEVPVEKDKYRATWMAGNLNQCALILGKGQGCRALYHKVNK